VKELGFIALIVAVLWYLLRGKGQNTAALEPSSPSGSDDALDETDSAYVPSATSIDLNPAKTTIAEWVNSFGGSSSWANLSTDEKLKAIGRSDLIGWPDGIEWPLHSPRNTPKGSS
jgi:hypothetical protein